jgi:GrpB-like predicted nucleotidyltransferase (UPF0157 family)
MNADPSTALGMMEAVDEPSIGLSRGIVRLHAPDSAWPNAFRAEATRLERQIAAVGLPPLPFEHIGSTAVPDLDSKPIIDMMAGYEQNADPSAYFEVLIAAGYEHRGPQGIPNRELFVLGAESRRTHHLNLIVFDGQLWRDHLAFRDRLRRDPELRDAYAALKRRLAAAHPNDRVAYTAGKAAFITQTIAGRRPLPER